MKTVVFQSFRRTGVPDHLERCMATVRAWAKENGFDYRFFGDELFERVPSWLAQKCTSILPKTDYARMKLAQELAEEGYGRTVWIDADLLVFDPVALALPEKARIGFVREIWVDADELGRTRTHQNIANAISLYSGANDFLSEAIEACERRAKSQDSIDRLDFGTKMLTDWRWNEPPYLFQNVSLFSPPVLLDIARGGGPALNAHMRATGKALAAANLCHSLIDSELVSYPLTSAKAHCAIDRLLKDHAELLGNAMVEPFAVFGRRRR
jgi:hypothetical protein